MAKTKRRSCKGGRKSRRCRGGTKSTFINRFRTPYTASSAERGFLTGDGVSRLGLDTKQAERVLKIGPTHEDINDIEHSAKNYMRMRAFRKSARALKDSVFGLPGKLRDSVSGIYKRLTTDPRFEKHKLVRANIETRNSDEGAGVQNFLKRSNEIYDSKFHKVGQYYDGHPYFLPGHYDPEVSWTMSKMDPLSKH